MGKLACAAVWTSDGLTRMSTGGCRKADRKVRIRVAIAEARQREAIDVHAL